MSSAVRAYLHSIARDPLREDLRATAEQRVVGRFRRCEIDSTFQAIFRLEGGDPTAAEPVAYQALARVHGEGGAELSPWNLFALAASDDDLVILDRRCRVVHTLNFFGPQHNADLLLNVHERLLTAVEVDHGRAFQRVLVSLAIAQPRVIIVLPLLTQATLDHQSQVIANYRLNGFRVAATVDRPATLQALLERIPVDVVRVDARYLQDGGWRRLFAPLAAAGTAIHATRIDDAHKLAAARASGATHAQGWALADCSARVPDFAEAAVGG